MAGSSSPLGTIHHARHARQRKKSTRGEYRRSCRSTTRVLSHSGHLVRAEGILQFPEETQAYTHSRRTTLPFLCRRLAMSGPFRGWLTCRLLVNAFRKPFGTRFAIPLLECLGTDFPGDEKLGEFPALGLALERHASHQPVSGRFPCRVARGPKGPATPTAEVDRCCLAIAASWPRLRDWIAPPTRRRSRSTNVSPGRFRAIHEPHEQSGCEKIDQPRVPPP